MSDDNYSLKEFLAHSLTDMKQTVTAIHDDIKEIKADGKETKEKVAFQNGRVRKLEDRDVETSKILESTSASINSYEKDRAYFSGMIKVVTVIAVIVPTVCTIIFGLYMKNRDNQINQKIQEGIAQTLAEHEFIIQD